MALRNDVDGWGWPARLLHWTIAVIMIGVLILGIVTANFVADLQTRFELVQIHKSWGFTVFALGLLRLGWRLANPVTPAPPAGPMWEKRAAAISHAGFYVLMIALPVTGWLMASASPLQDMFSIRNMVFGLFELPDPFVPGDEALEGALRQVHFALGLTLAALLALHVGGALKHHFVARDSVLRRMIFGR